MTKSQWPHVTAVSFCDWIKFYLSSFPFHILFSMLHSAVHYLHCPHFLADALVSLKLRLDRWLICRTTLPLCVKRVSRNALSPFLWMPVLEERKRIIVQISPHLMAKTMIHTIHIFDNGYVQFNSWPWSRGK